MAERIRAAIAGYGNLGRGVESALLQNPDFSLEAIVTRRDPASLKPASGVRTVGEGEIASLQGQIDLLFVCGGSATDLPKQTPRFARLFNVVDSFDTHARIPEHFAAVDAAAREGGNAALISVGWDPGLFSLARLYENVVLPQGRDYTFWGRGISQGHSDAIRRLPGVLDARQYTVPVPGAVEAVRSGETPELTTRQKHRRECYVAAAPGTDLEKLTEQIKTMPNYFSDYDTTVTYVSLEELREQHRELPHGGFVIRNGRNGPEGKYRQTMEFRLELDSNPYFTGSVLAACGRAVYRLNQRGETGCRTILDIPPALLSPLDPEELRREFV